MTWDLSKPAPQETLNSPLIKFADRPEAARTYQQQPNVGWRPVHSIRGYMYIGEAITHAFLWKSLIQLKTARQITSLESRLEVATIPQKPIRVWITRKCSITASLLSGESGLTPSQAAPGPNPWKVSATLSSKCYHIDAIVFCRPSSCSRSLGSTTRSNLSASSR